MKCLVFGDIHGNATALEAVLAVERDFDSVIFLGDAVSPGPQPNETAELLSDLNGIFIRGNHEFTMLNPESTKNWPDGFKALMDWIYETFDASGYQLLQSFQKSGEFEVDGEPLVLAHGDENTTLRHVLPDAPDEEFAPLAGGSDLSRVFFGHSHIQFHRQVGNQMFINPGSIGQNRCGHVTACYGLLTDGVFTNHHVDYDPAPWVTALDRIQPLNAFDSFRGWFRHQLLTGFAHGKEEPWVGFAEQGYR